MRQAQFSCNSVEHLVSGPRQGYSRAGGCQQVNVQVTDATPHQFMLVNKKHHLLVGKPWHRGGGAWSRLNTLTRTRKLPQASSPRTNECIPTCPASSAVVNAESPCLKWSIQTEVSTSIMQRHPAGEEWVATGLVHLQAWQGGERSRAAPVPASSASRNN